MHDGGRILPIFIPQYNVDAPGSKEEEEREDIIIIQRRNMPLGINDYVILLIDIIIIIRIMDTHQI